VFPLLAVGSDHQVVERIRREAILASKLDHPGICGIHEVGQEGAFFYTAMQYVRGTALNQLLALARAGQSQPDAPAILSSLDRQTTSDSSTRERIDQLVLFVEQCAMAMHAAHECGVVHRDLKPANIMVTPNDQPVIRLAVRVADVGATSRYGHGPHVLRTCSRSLKPGLPSPSTSAWQDSSGWNS